MIDWIDINQVVNDSNNSDEQCTKCHKIPYTDYDREQFVIYYYIDKNEEWTDKVTDHPIYICIDCEKDENEQEELRDKYNNQEGFAPKGSIIYDYDQKNNRYIIDSDSALENDLYRCEDCKRWYDECSIENDGWEARMRDKVFLCHNYYNCYMQNIRIME